MKLLTDQRTPEKKYADALAAIFRATFPRIAEHWGDLTAFQNAPIYKGGLVENVTQAMGYPERGEFVVPPHSRFLRAGIDVEKKDGFVYYWVRPDEVVRVTSDDEIDTTLRSKPEIIADLEARLQESMTKAFFGNSLGETYDPDKYRKD